jgi:hypothetical protein
VVSWKLFGFRAARKGDYKLLWLPKPFGSNDWQLYDLAKDPGELHDLSKQQPNLRDEMAKAWERYARETDVVLPSVGVIFVYPIPQLPQQVSMDWQLFTPKLRAIPAATTDQAGGLPATLTPEDPVLRRRNFLINPQVPAMLTIPPPPIQRRITIPLPGFRPQAVHAGRRSPWRRTGRRTLFGAAG